MMHEARVRKGTKSCAECRRRKLRCTWPQPDIVGSETSPSQNACTPCTLHHRVCVPQAGRPRTAKKNNLSARDRISNLEHEITRLADAVSNRQLPTQERSSASGQEQPTAPSPDASDVEDARSPTHLRRLFDNFAVRASYNIETEHRPGHDQEQDIMVPRRSLSQKVRASLIRLLPPKQDVAKIAGYASRWTATYHELFPAVSSVRASGDGFLVAQYDDMCDPLVRATALAAFLLSVAITAQQIAAEDASFQIAPSGDVQDFVDEVSRTVEKNIIMRNAIAGTVEGLETTLLYVRLQLGRGNLKNMWLTLRRAIALAELIGLPRAAYDLRQASASDHALHTSSDRILVETQSTRLKAELWDAICATDRNASMMFNLPAATASYSFPLARPLIANGRVSSQVYNYQLSNICLRVFEIDEMVAHNIPELEIYEKVLSADRRLRALAAEMDKQWWTINSNRHLAEQLVQFWHYYILARVHLHPGLVKNVDDQCMYSRSACLEACQQVVRRYVVFREQLASGFFVCRVVDIQAFTAAVFLLTFSEQPAPTQADGRPSTTRSFGTENALESVEQLIQVQRSISNKPGSDSAREAIEVLESLQALVRGDVSTVRDSLTLRVPLLGKIRVSMHRQMPSQRRQNLSQNRPEAVPTMDEITGLHEAQLPTPSSAADMETCLPWLLEIDTTASWLNETFTSDDLTEWIFS